MDIDYRRLDAGTETYRQQVVHADTACIVTFQPRTSLPGPVEVRGGPILLPESPVVWFTFPGVWHDIGRFYLPGDRFTGIYANVLTPVEFQSPHRWATTDLLLDVWMPDEGEPQILDQDELAQARRTAAINEEMAGRAEEEARRLVAGAAEGQWPPRIVADWTLERIRAG